MAQLLERPCCVRKILGSIPGRIIPKTSNIVIAFFRLALSIERVDLEFRTGWPGIRLCDWVEYHAMCLGRDISVRQHTKSDH